MTDDELARLEALAQAATPGPWESWRSGNAPLKVGGCGQSRLKGPERPYNPRWVGYENPRTAEEQHRTCVMIDADADFVAAARDAVPALVAEVRQLKVQRSACRAEADALRAENELLRKPRETFAEFEVTPQERYEQAAKERDALRAENDRLRAMVAALGAENERLRGQVEALLSPPLGTKSRTELGTARAALLWEREQAAELRAGLADAVAKIARMDGVVAAARVVAAEEKASPYVPRTSTYVLIVRVDEYEASLPDPVPVKP